MNDSDTLFLVPEVQPAEKNMRLDKFLCAKIDQMSRAQIQRLIENGFVTADDVIICDNAYKIKSGETFQVTIPPPQEAEPIAQDLDLDVVYEDEDVIVVNKPAGMTVHPAPGAYRDTLVNALLFHCCDHLSGIGGVKRPGIVHRIDKDTSGLLVAAKNDAAHHFLSAQFAEHSIKRTYYAVVYGVCNPLDGTINKNIARSKFDRKKMAVTEQNGKTAVTHYKTLKCFGREASLVQCNLETGRTHQIRVHLSSEGHALVGDSVYEKSKKSAVGLPAEVKEYVNNFPRQALHAKSLGFIHPQTKQMMLFDSELPADMAELIAVLSAC